MMGSRRLLENFREKVTTQELSLAHLKTGIRSINSYEGKKHLIKKGFEKMLSFFAENSANMGVAFPPLE